MTNAKQNPIRYSQLPRGERARLRKLHESAQAIANEADKVDFWAFALAGFSSPPPAYDAIRTTR